MLLNEIYIFICVIKAKSISKAAKQLGMSGAAISKALTRLEKEHNITLLNRTTRSLSMTEAGIALYQKSESIYDNMQEATDFLLHGNTSMEGRIKIGVPIFFLQIIFANIIPEFRKKYPDIQFELFEEIRSEYPQPGEYDFFIKAGDCKDSSIFRVATLAEWKYVICASPEYLKEHRTPEKPEDLINHDCLDFNYRFNGRIWNFYYHDKKIKVPVQSYVDASSSKFVIQCAINGGGIINVPSFTVNQYIKSGELIPILTDYNYEGIKVSLLHSYKPNTIPKKVKVFIDYLKNHLKENDYKYLGTENES